MKFDNSNQLVINDMLDMHKNIKDSVLKVIKKTNHSNIIFNKEIIKIIDEFLD